MFARRRFPVLAALVCGAFVATAAPAVSTPTLPTSAGVLAADSTAVQNPDGSWTRTFTASSDTWVDSQTAKTSQYTSKELRVGSKNFGYTKARSYLRFDLSSLAGTVPGAVISAEVKVSNFATGSCKGSAVRMSLVTGAWSETTLAWSKQPTTTANGSSTSTAAYGGSTCAGEGLMTFDAKEVAKAWFTAGASNYGVQLKADSEASSAGYRILRSLENGDAAKAPKLVITYNSIPSKGTSLEASPILNGYIPTTTPTVSAIISDIDGGVVRGYFEVYNADGSALLWSGYSDWGTSGDRLGVQVPEGILTDGPFAVAAYSEDPSYRSLSAGVKGFKIDATAPEVAITATAFTDGEWTSPVPESNTFTLDGPADTYVFSALIDGYPFTLYPSSSGSGDFSFPWVPTSGWHTIKVTATDKAGNVGPETTFSFGVGTPPAP